MVTVLDTIIKKLKEVQNPKKILISYKSWNKMVEEENLMGKFCVKCKNFVTTLHCNKCKDKEEIIDKELPILTILDLPYEMSSNIEDVEVV